MSRVAGKRVSELAFDELVHARSMPELDDPSQMFLRNQLGFEIERLETPGRRDPTGRFYGVFGTDGIELLAFFGETRVLCLGPGKPDAALALEELAQGRERGFRILIGPRSPASAILGALRGRVRVDLDRSQPFLAMSKVDVAAAGSDSSDTAALGSSASADRADTRAAGEAGASRAVESSRVAGLSRARLGELSDIEWLCAASMQLNEEDLGIAPRSVDRKLLEQRVRERIHQERTWVVDVDRRPVCKLEVGCQGPAGALIEGVYTSVEHRGKGLATELVRTVGRHLLHRYPWVGLHVGRDNTPAVRAYLAAGLREVADLELALIAWS